MQSTQYCFKPLTSYRRNRGNQPRGSTAELSVVCRWLNEREVLLLSECRKCNYPCSTYLVHLFLRNMAISRTRCFDHALRSLPYRILALFPREKRLMLCNASTRLRIAAAVHPRSMLRIFLKSKGLAFPYQYQGSKP